MRVNRSLVFAGGAFVLTLGLGLVVSHGPATHVDAGAFNGNGTFTGLARFFTAAGRFPTYAMLCAVSLLSGIIRRAWLARAALAVVGLITVWQTSDALKLVLARPRPLDPILPEPSFSYPSGHADLAVFFYGLWAVYVWRTALSRPIRLAVVSVAATWILAIAWSRMALGAHYFSDMLGGVFWGAGWLFVALFALERLAIGPRRAVVPDHS